MKANKLYFLLALTTTMFACTKKTDDLLIEKPDEVANTDSSQISQRVTCSPPNYGDSILCYQWLPWEDYKVSPLNNSGRGKYVATPEGLVINSSTGEINLSQSETGLAFKVGFIPQGSNDTCFTKIITAGINYLDGIHVLSDNDTLAVPIYNGVPGFNPVCAANGPANGCEYDDDDDDDNGNGPRDEPPAGFSLSSQNIKIDKRTGVISLRRSVLDGLFGTLAPRNGKTVNVTLYYRLNDCSNGALRKIDLKFTYYSKLSDVPKALINDINNVVDGILNLVFRTDQDKIAKPRPPHIVVVANR